MSKPRQPKLTLVSILLTLGAFALFVLATILDFPSYYNTIMMTVGMALLLAAWGIYFLGGRSALKNEAATENVITVIGCRGCDVKEERTFAPGDYIFKELGQCKKCTGKAFIRAIYAVPLKSDER